MGERLQKRDEQQCLTRLVSQRFIIFILIATAATSVSAQSPWERAAINLELTFTGPLARSLALVSIVIGGLMFMFGEAGAKRQISGIVFGGGLALFATQFLAWLF
jgi:type IV secretory pathway VirB2 component (pilin)